MVQECVADVVYGNGLARDVAGGVYGVTVGGPSTRQCPNVGHRAVAVDERVGNPVAGAVIVSDDLGVVVDAEGAA